MNKNIKSFIIIAGSSLLAAAFYKISAQLYSWHYSYSSPIGAPFMYMRPEIRPIIGLYWSLPPLESLAYSIFFIMHGAEALLIFVIAATAMKYLFGQQVQITHKSVLKGVSLFFMATISHVLLNGTIIYTLLSYADYGSLIGLIGIWSIPFSMIFSFFTAPLAALFLFINFFAAAALRRPSVSLKNAYAKHSPSLGTMFQWSYILALINCFSIIISNIFFYTYPSTAITTTCLYMGIITTSTLALACSWLNK